MAKLSNFQLRLISGIVLLPLILLPIYWGGYPFLALLAVLSVLMLREWLQLTRGGQPRWLWIFLGLLWVGVPMASFWLLNLAIAPNFVFMLLAVVIGADIAAYLGGKAIGGPKLAPQISPGKTISGALCGIIAPALGVYLFYFNEYSDRLPVVLFAVYIVVVSQLSDLLESAIKRRFGVKDSGTLIPGHGGILDRTDSFVLAFPAAIPGFLWLAWMLGK